MALWADRGHLGYRRDPPCRLHVGLSVSCKDDVQGSLCLFISLGLFVIEEE